MKIVITGASGFLGKALHKMLLEQGNEVYGFTRNSIDGLICVSDYKHLPKIDDAVLVHLAQSRNTSTFYDHDEVDLCLVLQRESGVMLCMLLHQWFTGTKNSTFI